MSAELKKFQTSARAVMRKVALYVQDGGDVLTSSQTESALYKARDRLVYDQMRKLGLTEDLKALELAPPTQGAP